MPPAPRNAPSPATPPERTVLIAGAGIGGLTAALALAREGFRVRLLEGAETPQAAGAGIQLSPNATRILLSLGLGPRLAVAAVAPRAIRMRSAARGRVLAEMPLGPGRDGAPYWVIHRADLYRALFDAVAATPAVTLTLGARVRDFHSDGAAVRASVGDGGQEEGHHEGAILIGADGLWSRLRTLLLGGGEPRFSGRCAFRAVVPAEIAAAAFRDGAVDVWLGPGGHVVHYPVRGGTAVNVVAVCGDRRRSEGWGTAAATAEVLARFPAPAWACALRELLAAPERWQRWALYDREPLRAWGRGPVTLLGDAAHPMLPFIAQGAAMAIEDAAVLARELGRAGDGLAPALRRYEAARAPRTARVQGAARSNDFHYHVRGPAALVRDAVLRAAPPRLLLARYDWIWGWQQ